MAKFFGTIGYGVTVEKAPGVFEDTIVEKQYYGDIVRNSRMLQGGDKVNDNISVNNSISVVADAYAGEHFHAIRYVSWSGARWKVSEVTVQSPRLILQLGEVYNGPTA